MYVPQTLKHSGCAAVCREKFDLNDGVALRTLDVFAGCGGLSEGLHQVCAPAKRLFVLEQRLHAAAATSRFSSTPL